MLPADIMLDIFTRLPAESVLECKLVSKTWKTIIQHPSFSQLHFNHQNSLDSADSGKIGFLFLMGDKGMGTVSEQVLYYVEYNESSSDNETPSCRVQKMSLNPPFKVYSLVGSCNGLVCLIGLPSHYTWDDSDQASYVAYICNPITRESIMLPELERRSRWDVPVSFFSIGFGYVPSTDEYKVVRLYRFRRVPEFVEIEVYTLGSGKGWRNRNEGKKLRVGYESCGHGVFANGCVYWDFGEGKIVAFDLADEMFVKFSVIPEFLYRHFDLGVLGECLCAYNYTKAKISDVWLLEKKQDESLMSCSMGFSLTNMDGYVVPLALTSNGTVLCYSHSRLNLYDLKSSACKALVDIGSSFYQARPHRNTLVCMESIRRADIDTLESK